MSGHTRESVLDHALGNTGEPTYHRIALPRRRVMTARVPDPLAADGVVAHAAAPDLAAIVTVDREAAASWA